MLNEGFSFFHSFLNEQKNTDLIRWSDKGDSFIVLDEDEFAKTLIPELFKHNNYASFVRQLNMYGFHKRVGLSDNSMKASERKNKSPSEYHNPYFRKGYSDLLWLINKPKNNAGKKKKKDDGEGDSDDEAVADDSVGQGAAGHGKIFSGELSQLQRKDITLVRDQIKQLQETQSKLQAAIARISKDQKELINRAVLFQQLHDRHDRSINLILSFLANVYRKSLEDAQGNNVAELLASILPPNNSAPQGTVIDYENFLNSNGHQQPVNSPAKRPQRLLTGIPQHRPSPVTTTSSPAKVPSSTGSAGYTGIAPHFPKTGKVTEVLDASPADTTTPAYLKRALENNPQEGMMKILEGTTTATPSPSNVAIPPSVASTASAMTNNHRAQLFNAMATQASTEAPNPAIASPTPITPSASVATMPAPDGLLPLTDNTSMSPSNLVSDSIPRAALSGSPVSTSPSMSIPATNAPLEPSIPQNLDISALVAPQPPLSLHNIPDQNEIEEIRRLSEEQSNKLNDLANLLGPLSPSGRIPGIDEHGNAFYDVDMDQFLNPEAFPSDDGVSSFDITTFAPGGGAENSGSGGASHVGTGHDIPGFSLDASSLDNSISAPQGGVSNGVMSTEGSNIPSPATTEDIPRDDISFASASIGGSNMGIVEGVGVAEGGGCGCGGGGIREGAIVGLDRESKRRRI